MAESAWARRRWPPWDASTKAMHELSIALSLVDAAEEEAARQGEGRVTALHVRIGPLSGVVPKALLSAFGLACEGSAIAGSKLIIEEVPILIHCPTCGGAQSAVSPQLLCCWECGGPPSEVIQGRELELTALEIQ